MGNSNMNQEQTSLNKFYYIPSKGKLNPVSTSDEAINSLKHGGFIWLNYLDPSREKLTRLVEPLGIHPVAIEDCLDEEQIPKINDYQTNTFLIFNSFCYEKQTIVTSEIDIFLGKNYLILVSNDKSRNKDIFEKFFEMVNRDLAHATGGADFLMQIILDHIIDGKFQAIEALEDEMNSIEEVIFKVQSGFKPENLMRIRRNLLIIRKSLIHERENLVKICRKDSPFISEKAIYQYRDIYDHLTKFYESAEILREMIGNFMEMHLSVMNNHMSMIANRTNKSVRRLTLLSTIFMPLTLLAGIGGMSEWSMMTGPQNWKVAYPLFLLLMAIIGGFNYILLKNFESREKKRNSKSSPEQKG
jgi:magnesium transporter